MDWMWVRKRGVKEDFQGLGLSPWVDRTSGEDCGWSRGRWETGPRSQELRLGRAYWRPRGSCHLDRRMCYLGLRRSCSKPVVRCVSGERSVSNE